MAPILIHVDLGHRRVIPVRTFVNIESHQPEELNAGQTLKFQPINRIILKNKDLQSFYNDETIKEVLCNLLFVYNEEEFKSISNNVYKDSKTECVVKLNSEHWRAQLNISWNDIELLRSSLMEQRYQFDTVVIVNKNSHKVSPVQLKVIINERLI